MLLLFIININMKNLYLYLVNTLFIIIVIHKTSNIILVYHCSQCNACDTQWTLDVFLI